jgi:hypothetical protein
MGVIANIKITYPLLDEQEAIARFLDYKTKQIDDLIAKKEALIEKLDEKRTALISHAVTKGLDPNVPMKDSGIDWLGEIPEHWEVSRPKYLCSRIVDGTHQTPEYIDFGIPFLTFTKKIASPSPAKSPSKLDVFPIFSSVSTVYPLQLSNSKTPSPSKLTKTPFTNTEPREIPKTRYLHLNNGA